MDALLSEDFANSGLVPDSLGNLGFGLASLMDELAYGIVVTNLHGQVLHANEAARHELHRGKALVVTGGQVRAPNADGHVMLVNAMVLAAAGKRSLIALPGDGGPALSLAVLPLRNSPGVAPTRMALLFSRASVCDSLMLCFFARSHGLTSTEEHVLGLLCQGFTARETAAQMKVAISTVRSHVRGLCVKTRSAGVRELLTRVAMLPPVAPAIRHEQVH